MTFHSKTLSGYEIIGGEKGGVGLPLAIIFGILIIAAFMFIAWRGEAKTTIYEYTTAKGDVGYSSRCMLEKGELLCKTDGNGYIKVEEYHLKGEE